VSRKEDFWNDPQGNIKGEWAEAHQAFARIIFRMLRRDPDKRWASFDELIMRLRTMEDESRALAKRTYEGLDGNDSGLKQNKEFFRSFYHEFFQRAPQAEGKFDKSKVDQQHEKLMEAMVAVLNFRAGNEPTALREVVAKHLVLKKGITSEEVDKFVQTFVDTLEIKLPRNIPKQEREKIVAAWTDLFSPVAEYFKEELEKAAQRAGAKG
jgi:hemoglobin-like flavoprotein